MGVIEMNDMCPSSLTKEELEELRKEFQKIIKKRKTIKDYISALKNYDYVVAELFCTRNKLNASRHSIKVLNKFSEQQEKEILHLQQKLIDNEKYYQMKYKDFKNIQNKLEITEERRRVNSGKIGGLVKQNNILNQKNELYLQIISSKDRDLEHAAIIIQNLNKKIKSLRNKPTIQELREYERTRKSPRKIKK